MNIFAARPDDVPRILDCARAFCAVLGIKLNAEHYEREWRRMLEDGTGCMFLMESIGRVVGGIGGTRCQDLLEGHWLAVEQFWYVDPEFRKGTAPMRLLRMFEDWAKAVGCAVVAMIHMVKSMPDEIEAIYLKCGYVLIEKHFTKRLTT